MRYSTAKVPACSPDYTESALSKIKISLIINESAKCQNMNVIYSMMFWGICLPRSFDLWAFLFLRQHLSSRTSFQKQFLLILQNRKSLWKVPKKNTILPQREHFYFQSGTKTSFNTIFSRLRSFVPKEMPVQQ